MRKLFKISLIFAILFCFYITISQAETTNLYNDVVGENTTSHTSNTNNSDSTTTNTAEENEDNFDLLEEDLEEDNSSETTSQSTSTPASTYSSSINTISSISEANLGLNNVLCIILIAIGVLIILLAIAILIRLKK